MWAFWNKPTKCSPVKKILIDNSPSEQKKDDSLEKIKELEPRELKNECDSSMFNFTSTKEVIIEDETIGQERALKAIDFGLHIKSSGFNIYVCGLSGTGKNSTVVKAVQKIAQSEPVPDDICYLYNFKNPDSPRVVTLPVGQGKLFKQDIENLVKMIKDEIQNAFSIGEYDRHVEALIVRRLFEEMRRRYCSKEVAEYFDELSQDILDNLDYFKVKELRENNSSSPELFQESFSNKYTVNVLIDNSRLVGAPVIIEQNPTLYNINGYIEYRVQMGFVNTDFLMIRAGAAHKARGGYLIIQAQQLLRNPTAWDSLKKILSYNSIKIENIAERYGFVPAAGLKPQSLPVNLKVILVGNPYIFQMLFEYDEDFLKLFKIKADFEESLKKSENLIRKYVSLIARICRDDLLRPCDRNAVAKLIDYGSRLAGHKKKISAQFMETADILHEADYWAAREQSAGIKARHVEKAFEEKCFRSNSLEENIQELIEENTIIIDVEGMEVGQVNGVSLIDTGDYVFGKPSRITAKTYIGPGNIINIEREAEMSGRIHSKGILILSGYLGQTYAQDKPLAMSASICFEQHYEEIEGDSASSAELYCLLSSLSGLPLRQDLAVTGSVDQRGKVQPVGGINQKIEGFYKCCKIKGLSGTQGVIIPVSNVKHLMLSDEVIKSVKDGLFHIYPVSTINEGLKILTGAEPGIIGSSGHFNVGSVHFLVNKKLREYASIVSNFEIKKEQN